MPHKCSVPGCRTNYQDGPKFTVFSFPKDADLKQKWLRAIRREDFVPSKYSKVCGLHFESACIQRHFTHVINGQEVRLPRDHVKLVTDAVPTIFPDRPANLLGEIPKKSETLDRGRVSQKQMSFQIDHASDCRVQTRSSKSKKVCVLHFQETDIERTVSATDNKTGRVITAKLGRPRLAEGAIPCQSPNGSENLSLAENSPKRELPSSGSQSPKNVTQVPQSNLKRKLNDVPGQPKPIKTCSTESDSHFETIITVVEEIPDSVSACTPVEKATNQVKTRVPNLGDFSAVKLAIQEKTIAILREKTYLCRKQIKRLHVRQQSLKETISKMKQDLSDERRKNKLSLLSERQQQIVTHMVRASKCKGSQGMRYETDWIMDCALLRAKSATVYDFLRHNDFLPLPNRTTLDKYVQKLNLDLDPEQFSHLDEEQTDIPTAESSQDEQNELHCDDSSTIENC